MRAWALTFLLPCLPCLPPTSAGVTDEIMLPKSQEKAVQLPGAIKLTCYGRMGLTPHARAAEGQTGQAEATQNGRLSGRSGESVCLGPESSPLGSLGGQRRASLWIQSSQTGMSFSELPKEGSGLQGSGSQLAHKGSPGVGWGGCRLGVQVPAHPQRPWFCVLPKTHLGSTLPSGALNARQVVDGLDWCLGENTFPGSGKSSSWCGLE